MKIKVFTIIYLQVHNQKLQQQTILSHLYEFQNEERKSEFKKCVRGIQISLMYIIYTVEPKFKEELENDKYVC